MTKIRIIESEKAKPKIKDGFYRIDPPPNFLNLKAPKVGILKHIQSDKDPTLSTLYIIYVSDNCITYDKYDMFISCGGKLLNEIEEIQFTV